MWRGRATKPLKNFVPQKSSKGVLFRLMHICNVSKDTSAMRRLPSISDLLRVIDASKPERSDFKHGAIRTIRDMIERNRIIAPASSASRKKPLTASAVRNPLQTALFRLARIIIPLPDAAHHRRSEGFLYPLRSPSEQRHTRRMSDARQVIRFSEVFPKHSPAKNRLQIAGYARVAPHFLTPAR